MLTVFLLLGLFSTASGDAQKNDTIVKAYLDHMKLARSCSSKPDYEWAMSEGRRAIRRADPDTQFKVSDVSQLDKQIRAGTAELPSIKPAKCDDSLKDSHADIERLRDQ